MQTLDFRSFPRSRQVVAGLVVAVTAALRPTHPLAAQTMSTHARDPLAGELRVMLAADSSWHPARVVMIDGCPAITVADIEGEARDRRALRRVDRFAAVERRTSAGDLWERVAHATLRELESCAAGGRRG